MNYLEQFHSFVKKNNIESTEEAIKLFSIFGGLDSKIDTSAPTIHLIEDLILDEYSYHNRKVIDITGGDRVVHSFLTGIAMGDGRIHSAMKRARINEDDLNYALDLLSSNEIVTRQPSEKLYFNTPFLRFWFAFVSPIFHGILDNDYSEFKERYLNREQEFLKHTFERLSMDLLKEKFSKEDQIVNMKSIKENGIDIEILAKTKSGKIVVGVCKYSDSKAKKNELTKLRENCNKLNIEPDICVIFSKKGFNKDLKSLKSETVRLFKLTL